MRWKVNSGQIELYSDKVCDTDDAAHAPAVTPRRFASGRRRNNGGQAHLAPVAQGSQSLSSCCPPADPPPTRSDRKRRTTLPQSVETLTTWSLEHPTVVSTPNTTADAQFALSRKKSGRCLLNSMKVSAMKDAANKRSCTAQHR
jgi:hypothetical protein